MSACSGSLLVLETLRLLRTHARGMLVSVVFLALIGSLSLFFQETLDYVEMVLCGAYRCRDASWVQYCPGTCYVRDRVQ